MEAMLHNESFVADRLTFDNNFPRLACDVSFVLFPEVMTFSSLRYDLSFSP